MNLSNFRSLYIIYTQYHSNINTFVHLLTKESQDSVSPWSGPCNYSSNLSDFNWTL